MMKVFRSSIIGCLLPLVFLNCGMLQKTAPYAANDEAEAERQGNSAVTDGTCWFNSGDAFAAASDEMKNRRYERQSIFTYGFLEDTSLVEAVTLYNEEMRCDALQRAFPPLTGDEVVAAIVEGVNQNGRRSDFTAERDTFWKIATERRLPKGTLLSARVGSKMVGSPIAPKGIVETTGIEIYLQLNADRMGRTEPPQFPLPQEYLIVRKTFTKAEVSGAR